MKGQALEKVGEGNCSPTLHLPASVLPTTVDGVLTIANTSLATGEVVTFEVSPDPATFKYLNLGGAKAYDLGLEQAGVYSGTVSLSGDLQMEATGI